MLIYFMKSHHQKKVEILKSLIFYDGVTRKQIVRELDISSSSFRRYIAELSNDLEVLFYGEVSLSLIKHKYKVNRSSNLTVDYIILKLQSFYFKSTPLYSLMRALTSKEYSSTLDLSYDLNYSESSIYKLLTDAQKILKHFNANISLKDGPNFTGNELGVRYFLYLLYWNFLEVSDEAQIFENIPQKFTDSAALKESLDINKELSKSQENNLKILFVIISIRLNFDKASIDIDDHFFKEIAPFQYNNSSLLKFLNFSNIPLQVLEKEARLLQFLVHASIFDIIDFSTKKYIVIQYEQSELEISNKIKEFLKILSDVFHLKYKRENYIESYYILLTSLLSIKYFHLNIDNFLRYPVSEQLKDLKKTNRYFILKRKIKKHLNLFFKTNSISQKELEFFELITYSLYEINRTTETLYLYINNHSDISTALFIKEKLRQFFNSELISFSATPSNADIIISNTFENCTTQRNVFFYENIYDKETWIQLITFLSAYIADNNLI